MNVLRVIGLYSIGVFAFIVFTSLAIDEFNEIRALIEMRQNEKVEHMVQGKTAERDLFGGMTYYALLEGGDEDKVVFNNEPRTYAEISKNEFKGLKDGDELEGMPASTEFSDEDVRSEINHHLIFMAIFLIYPVFFLLYQLTHIPLVDRWLSKYDNPLGKLLPWLFIGGICVALLFAYFTLGKWIFHTIQAHSGVQVETTAQITDRYMNINYGKGGQDYYYLALAYADQEGNMIHLTKEVPPSVYEDNEDSLKIGYTEGHPSRIHIIDAFIFRDFFFYVSIFFIYVIVVPLTVLVAYAAYKMMKMKQNGEF